MADYSSYVTPETIKAGTDLTASIVNMFGKGSQPSNTVAQSNPNTNNQYQMYLDALLGANKQQQQKTQNNDNTMKYIAIGGGVLVVMVILFMAFKKR